MAVIEYSKELRKLREYSENFGKISWANSNDNRLYVSYSELVDIFGNNLNSCEKSKLVRVMCENSGYSDNWAIKGKKPPITIGVESLFQEGYRNPVALVVYPKEIDSGVAYHEGVHFLAKYGHKNTRLIRRDIPLAKVLGTFFRLLGNPEEEFKYLTGENLTKEQLDLCERVAVNPFRFQMREHSEEENREASLFAISAYSIASRKNKQTAIDYIKKKYEGK